MKFSKGLFLFLLILLFLGCLTLEQRYSSTTEDIIQLINSGQSDSLSAMTDIPFLLDGEILLLQKDTTDFWQTIVQAGFTIPNPQLIEVFSIDDTAFTYFAETMEVESFFKKYASENSHIAIIETADIKILLLLKRTKTKEMKLIGFRGPIEK